jgi:hypothetical protein
MGGGMDTLFLCLGSFVAGLGLGGLLGMLVTRADDRPAVTPWGENTALWADHDWDWWHRCGKHSEPGWAGRQRSFVETTGGGGWGGSGEPWYVEQGDRVRDA